MGPCLLVMHSIRACWLHVFQCSSIWIKITLSFSVLFRCVSPGTDKANTIKTRIHHPWITKTRIHHPWITKTRIHYPSLSLLKSDMSEWWSLCGGQWRGVLQVRNFSNDQIKIAILLILYIIVLKQIITQYSVDLVLSI